MAEENPTDSSSSVDPRSGFCSKTLVYHSLRPPAPLPPLSTNVADYVFSLLAASPPPPTTPAIIDATTSRRIFYPEFIRRVKSLAYSLRSRSRLRLSRGDCALIISPNTVNVPILNFALLSISVTVSPINPASTKLDILHHIHLSKPIIMFTTSGAVHKVPSLPLGMVILDSADFESMMNCEPAELDRVEVSQSDTASILYSSGITGRVKGVELTHWNFIYSVALGNALRATRQSPAVMLCSVPYFHVYEFGVSVRALGMGETVVVMGSSGLGAIGIAIDEFMVTHAALAAMAKDDRVLTDGCDLRSLEVVASGAAEGRLGWF